MRGPGDTCLVDDFVCWMKSRGCHLASEWEEPFSDGGWSDGARSPSRGIHSLPALVSDLVYDIDMSLTLYISPGAHLHIIYLLPALLVKQGLTFFWICWREHLTLCKCCSISIPAKQGEESFKNREQHERTHSWLVILGAQSTHPSSATHSICVTVSFFCVPTCQERRLNRMVNKRSPNSGRQSFCVLSTCC